MPGFVSQERLARGPWSALERMLARLIEHSGFRDVMLVGGAGDRGADVVGTAQGKRWVLQAKYRSSGGMNSEAAREAVRALSPYEADVAIAATNGYFTQDAYNFHSESQAAGIDLRLWNGSSMLGIYAKLPGRSAAYRDLRDYQVDAVDGVEQRRSDGRPNALVLMATGLGKSMVASQLISNELERNPGQEVLVLAHTRDLVRQLEVSSWSQLEKSHSTHLWTDGEKPEYSGGVVFATWQSVASAQDRESLAGRFGLVIVDEAHHAPSVAYRRLLDNIAPNFLVGLTATPWRGDEQDLEEMFGAAVFTMDIVDGMQRGFLAEVDYQMLTDGIEWDEVALMSEQGMTLRDLNQHLVMPDRDVSMVDLVSERFAQTPKPRALGFCRSINHAERLRPLFASRGVKTAIMHSGLDRETRFRNLSAFRAGNIDLLLSVEMLNEGIDVPDVNLVIFMRVTHSRRIFVQQLGRGLRVNPGKSTVTVLDFVADIRRIAAGLEMNRQAALRAGEPEVIRFSDGRVITFENDQPSSFFDEYLADVAEIENMEDGARLRFPDNRQADNEQW